MIDAQAPSQALLKKDSTVELLSGGEMLIRALHDAGVEYIYGYPGGSLLHVYDAMYKQNAVKHILVRHEQTAAHMADGYARATSKPGVVMVTSGPGATNTITGVPPLTPTPFRWLWSPAKYPAT